MHTVYSAEAISNNLNLAQAAAHEIGILQKHYPKIEVIGVDLTLEQGMGKLCLTGRLPKKIIVHRSCTVRA